MNEISELLLGTRRIETSRNLQSSRNLVSDLTKCSFLNYNAHVDALFQSHPERY